MTIAKMISGNSFKTVCDLMPSPGVDCIVVGDIVGGIVGIAVGEMPFVGCCEDVVDCFGEIMKVLISIGCRLTIKSLAKGSFFLTSTRSSPVV